MGKLKALKGFGKAYEAFKKTVTAPETRTRNIESAKMFEKAKIILFDTLCLKKLTN